MKIPYRLIHRLAMAMAPETAHGATIAALRLGAARLFARPPDDPVLATRVLGLDFANPIGLAAGFDKDAEVPDAVLRLGFGFVEVGTLTPEAQPGNPRPRLFRLTEDRAVINRMGFNNRGAASAARRLAARQAGRHSGPVGINLGANKNSPDRIADFAKAAHMLAGLGDYYVINVSSPNTPGLRALQEDGALRRIISEVRAAIGSGPEEDPEKKGPPLLVKLSPDLTAAERELLAAVLLDSGIAGLIISNTTISRPDSLVSGWKSEIGGLSGAPLGELSTAALSDFYRLTRGRLPLIGSGGIATGREAYAKIRAGASLVQLYSALVFEGPGLVPRIGNELAQCLRADGFERIAEAVGADHK